MKDNVQEPIERYRSLGLSALDNIELISLISGRKIQKLPKELGSSLEDLSRMSHDELLRAGFTEMQSAKLIAGLELYRRKFSEVPQGNVITSSEMAARVLIHKIGSMEQEQFYVFFLNRSNRVLKESILFKGGISEATVDPILILKKAILLNTKGMIVGHNHPSGNLKPSPADVRLTAKIADSAKMMGIKLLDHIIVSSNGYYSFADEGRL